MKTDLCMFYPRKGFVCKQAVFVKHYAPGCNKVWKSFYKCNGHSQGHKVINLGVIRKGIISVVSMPNIKSLSLTIE